MIKFPSSQVDTKISQLQSQSINRSTKTGGGGPLLFTRSYMGKIALRCIALRCIPFALSNTYILLYYPILSNPIRSCLLLYSDWSARSNAYATPRYSTVSPLSGHYSHCSVRPSISFLRSVLCQLSPLATSDSPNRLLVWVVAPVISISMSSSSVKRTCDVARRRKSSQKATESAWTANPRHLPNPSHSHFTSNIKLHHSNPRAQEQTSQKPKPKPKINPNPNSIQVPKSK